MERIEKLKTFLKENPADSFVKHALALEYVKTGNDGVAEKLFNEILEHQPDYVGSYYHLGKLLERKNRQQEAIAVYENGMEQARTKGENHLYNELKTAWEELSF